MVTKETAINIAQSFVNDCKSNGISFDKVILLGSYATGNAHEGSDIDLVLVSDMFIDNIFRDINLYAKVNIKYPSIETHPISTKAFSASNPFIDEIKKNSITIC